MADATGGFDFQALLQNPLFLGGVSGLLSPPQDRAKALLGGIQTASTLKSQQQLQQLNALKLQQAQAQANFNPQDYMKTAPTPQGAGTATPMALQGQDQAPQMPATLGGPIGGQTQMQPAAPMAAPVQPQPGTPTGQVDMSGLLQGGMQAGMAPGEIQQLAGIMDPATAAKQAMAMKLMEPYTLSPGQTRMAGDQQLGTNTNAPPTDPAAVLARTQAAAAQARAAGNTALADQLDAAVQKQSGAFEQQQSLARLEELRTQHGIANDLRAQGQANTQQQRDFANTQQVQQQATKFSTQLEHTGIPQADQTLSTIEGIMSKYPPGKLPGYGRVEGLLPSSALSEDGQVLRQAVAQLANVNLKQRSGAAVTAQEYTRFKNELGNSTFMPEERIRQGIGQMRSLVEAQKKNAQAGVSDEVLNAYEGSGGMPLSYLRPNSGKRAPALALPDASISDIDAAIAKKMGK